jgi:hypothetical protein
LAAPFAICIELIGALGRGGNATGTFGANRVRRSCDLKNKVKVAAGTPFHLISAVPQAERDRYEIYPGDFRTALIPLPEQSNWDWRTFEEWERQGIVCGNAKKQQDWGLRDYSEPTRLLTKFGKYEFAYRQKGGAVWPGYDTAGPAEWSPVYAIRLGRLKTPDEQRTLKRIGGYYKNSCWWSKKESPRLFDRAESLSWQQARWWKPGQKSFQLEPADELKLAKKERAEMFRVARLGGSVQILGSPAKRHANLASTRDAYNEQWPSYWNFGTARTQKSEWDFGILNPKNGIAGIGEILQVQGSLNVPHETIELRNNMVANLERDFGRVGRVDQTKAA